MFRFRIPETGLRITILLAISAFATAQESPSPIETASSTPEQLPPPSPPASPTPNVPLRFIPPPMQGTISLGIFDSNDKLVRVLHREAKSDNFTVEESSLGTAWDGKNDAGEYLPPGKYRARGYMGGKVKVDDIGESGCAPESALDHVSVRLVTNPFFTDRELGVDLGIVFDDMSELLST